MNSRLYKRICIPLFFLVVAASSLYAKVELPSVIGDNMVLQQQTQVALWGRTTGKKVVISPSWTRRKTVVVPKDDGKWFTRISTPEAGGPYTITLNDGEKLTIENVLIGEVWYCSGQSNMEMPMQGFKAQPVEHSTDYILEASTRVPIRIFNVPNDKARSPKDDIDASWKENLPEDVGKTSAVAYFFACKIHKVLDVPVGIIIADVGGTSIEAWLGRDVIEKEFPGEFDTSILDTGELKDLRGSRHPSILYNGMVSALEPFTFKGMLWYQGENNRPRPEQYTRLQTAYANMMRERFQNPDAAFYFVQIAPFNYQPEGRYASGYFCEAQAKTLFTIPHSGMVTTTDIGSYSTIHPPKKMEVGNRLAYLALVNDYGIKGIDPVAPTYKSMDIIDGNVVLEFNADPLGIGPMNVDLPGFEVAGPDRVFHPVKARVVKKQVILICDEIPNPIAVRYCFRNWCVGKLANAYGIPVGPFRTDDWDDIEM